MWLLLLFPLLSSEHCDEVCTKRRGASLLGDHRLLEEIDIANYALLTIHLFPDRPTPPYHSHLSFSLFKVETVARKRRKASPS